MSSICEFGLCELEKGLWIRGRQEQQQPAVQSGSAPVSQQADESASAQKRSVESPEGGLEVISKLLMISVKRGIHSTTVSLQLIGVMLPSLQLFLHTSLT